MFEVAKFFVLKVELDGQWLAIWLELAKLLSIKSYLLEGSCQLSSIDVILTGFFFRAHSSVAQADLETCAPLKHFAIPRVKRTTWAVQHSRNFVVVA